MAIIGKPNTGKSTLMNKIWGREALDNLLQTTNHPLCHQRLLNDANRQIVFIDTPGYLKPRYEMQTRMLKIWSDAFKDVDLIVFMTDIAKFPTEYDKEVRPS